MCGNDLGVGEQQVSGMDGGTLRPKEELCASQRIRVIAAVQGISQNKVDKLVQEERRYIRAVADKVEISGLNGGRLEKPLAKGEHDAPVLPRVRVADGVNFLDSDMTPWRIEKAAMQRHLCRAGIIRRHKFRARKIGEKQFIGDGKPAVLRASRELMT
jgi:hypothetical protein